MRDWVNKVYKVSAGKLHYLFKAIGAVFSESAQSSIRVNQYLYESGVSVPPVVRTLSGALSYSEDEKSYALFGFIEGKDSENGEDTEALGEEIAKMHIAMEKYEIALPVRGKDYFALKYIDILKKKHSPLANEYAALGDSLWKTAEALPCGFCHMDMHRGNIIKGRERSCIIDFDTSSIAFPAYDIAVFCDSTDYFSFRQADKTATKAELDCFLSGYVKRRSVSAYEYNAIPELIALRHFQLQAVIVERFGLECIDERFISSQLKWLTSFLA